MPRRRTTYNREAIRPRSARAFAGKASSPVDPSVYAIGGFADSSINYMSASGEGIRGSTLGYWVGVVFIYVSQAGAGNRGITATNTFSGAGWAIYDASDVLTFRHGNGVATNISTTKTLVSGDAGASKVHAVIGRYNTTNIRAWLDNAAFSAGVSSVGYSPYVSTSPFFSFGASRTGASAGTNFRIAGVVGGDGLIPTDDEIAAWFASVKSSADIVAIPGKTTHLYSVKQSARSVPATFQDIQGDDDLTKAGSPTLYTINTPTYGW